MLCRRIVFRRSNAAVTRKLVPHRLQPCRTILKDSRVRGFVREMEDWGGTMPGDIFAPFNPYVKICDEWYRNAIRQGNLTNDLAQLRVIYRLQKLQDVLKKYNNQPVRLYRKKQDYFNNMQEILQRKLDRLRAKLQNMDAEMVPENIAAIQLDPDNYIMLKVAKDKLAKQIEALERQLAEKFSARRIDAAIVESDDEREEEDEEEDDKQDEKKEEQKDEDQERDISTSPTPILAHASVEATEMELPRIPRGFYLYGPVGTGKSMLMNILFMNTDIEKKMRFHMNDFMTDIHKRLNALQNPNNPKPIAVARQFAKEHVLIYIDEFNVTDVADAVLLRQILKEILRQGTVLLVTSNRSPSSLSSFGFDPIKPVADLIEKHCNVHEIQTVTDYRKALFDETLAAYDESKITKTYFVKTPEDDFRADIDYFFLQLLGIHVEATREDLRLASDRTLSATTYRKHDILVAQCQFADLCGNQYLGEVDYRALARQIDVLVLFDIPYLSDETSEDADRTRRFMTLIDTLYDWRRPIICTAVDCPTKLFRSGLQPAVADTVDGEVLDRLEATTPQGHSVGASVSVQDLSFSFARTGSRMMELTSAYWWRNVYEYFDFEER